MSTKTLQVYLADHLAGSRYLLRLLERCREEHGDHAALDALLAELQGEVEEDRAVLRAMLVRVGGSVSTVKEAGAWVLEQASRIKHLEPSRSAGSGLLERLETLVLGLSGKRALWRALEEISGGTGRFGGVSVELLRRRAEDQGNRVEEHRRRVAREVLGASLDASGAPERLRGVLLDLDGTLLDSNDAHARAWSDAFADAGRPVSFERVRPLIGLDGDRLIAELTDLDPDGAEAERISDRHTRRFLEDHLPSLEPTPGARDFVERLGEEGLVFCVATSAGETIKDAVMEAAGIDDLVACSTSASDVDEGKPDADLVEEALDAAGLDPAEAILVGDTPYDVTAGARTGVAVVALRCGGAGDAELSGAAALYDDPADVLSSWDGSPFAR